MQLVIIRGLPGSGKSTLAKTFIGFDHHEADDYFTDKEGNYAYVSKDIAKAHSQCLERTKKSMWHGRDVVVSNTFTQWWEMMPYLKCASENGYDIRIIETKGSYKNIHGVPQEAINRMAERWE